MLMPDNTEFFPVKNPNMSTERTAVDRLPITQRLSGFDAIESVYTEEQALTEASRCLKCPTHWCQNACPAGVPVTDFIAKVREGDYESAYQLITSASTLPEICSRVCPQEKQCQSNCTRGIRTDAVGIGYLERFVVEEHYRNGAPVHKAEPSGKKVAVIGSGPAGLSAAQRLTDLGHAVTVFERSDRIGGLMEYGIPNMKLDKDILARKVAAMEAQGVVFRTEINVGTDITAEELLAEYDAVILAIGTANARTPSIDGAEHAKGIVYAVDFLSGTTKSLLDSDLTDGAFLSAQDKNVIIIGGGDTGNDCVGTALRHGCVSIIQLEMLPENPNRLYLFDPYIRKPKEVKWDSSQEEHMHRFCKDARRYQTIIKSVQTDADNNLESVTVVSLGTMWENGKLNLAEIPGSEQVFPCQMLIVAAGFIGPDASIPEAFGLNRDARNNIKVEHYSTSVKKVFACGDCRTGQSLVVKAMVDGRECAMKVDAFLR